MIGWFRFYTHATVIDIPDRGQGVLQAYKTALRIAQDGLCRKESNTRIEKAERL